VRRLYRYPFTPYLKLQSPSLATLSLSLARPLSPSPRLQELDFFRCASSLVLPRLSLPGIRSQVILSDEPMATSQDARSAYGVDHSADHLHPETIPPMPQYEQLSQQPDVSAGIAVKAESIAPQASESLPSQRSARTKRKGIEGAIQVYSELTLHSFWCPD
jgi:hypothetical protein